MDEQPVGRRVAYWRTRRKLSQQLFADRLGKSKSWVDKVERGVRRLDRFSTIAEIADVLQVDVQALTGRDPVRRPEVVNCIDQIEVAEIRAALERYDRISAFRNKAPVSPPLTELRKSVDHAWMTFQRSRYGVLARSLPRLIRDAQAADAACSGAASTDSVSADDARCEAAYLLAEVYQIASSTLRKMGEHDLAWLAADRATMVCQRAGDELLAALATERVAGALAALGRIRPALEITVNIANQIAPRDGVDATPQRLSVYGMVLLQGAMAAARLGDSATVRDLLAGGRGGGQAGGRRRELLLDLVRPNQRRVPPGRGGGGVGRRRQGVAGQRRRSTRSSCRRCCRSGAPATYSTSPGPTPRWVTCLEQARRWSRRTGWHPAKSGAGRWHTSSHRTCVRRSKGALAPGMLELVDHMGLAG